MLRPYGSWERATVGQDAKGGMSLRGGLGQPIGPRGL